MSMSDPISDMLTRIRNAQMAEKTSVDNAFFEVEGGDRRGVERRRLCGWLQCRSLTVARPRWKSA